MKVRVSLKYFVSYCRFCSNDSGNPQNICLTAITITEAK